MLDANNPIPLTLVDLFGHPFHGLCKDGTLHLPNGQTMSYPQPSNGDVHVQRVPGAAGGAGLTPEQLAAETAAGHTWIDYGLLSGGSLQFWGHDIGGWIYIDPDGARWLVRLMTMPVAAGATMTVRLVRFGEFGGEPEAYDHAVTVPAYSTFDGSPVDALWLSAFSPDGADALLCGRTLVSEAYNSALIPLVWWRLHISGAGSGAAVSYSLELDGHETVVVGAHSPTINGFSVYNIGIQFDYAYIPDAVDPVCYDERNSVLGVTIAEAIGSNAVRVGSGTATLDISRWVVGYAWSGAGFEQISLRIRLTNSYNYPMPEVSASGSLSGGILDEGNHTYVGFSVGGAASSGSRTCSVDSSLLYQLQFGGGVVDSVSHSMQIRDTFNVNTTMLGLGDGGYRHEQHYVHTRSVTYDGITASQTPLDYHVTTYPHGNYGEVVDLYNLDESDAEVLGIGCGSAFCPDEFGAALFVASKGFSTVVGGLDRPVAACLACWAARDPAGVENVHRVQTAVQLISNSLAALVSTDVVLGSVPVLLAGRSCNGVFGPNGSAASPPSDLGSPISATWHPVTGAIAVDPDGFPICWV